MIWKDGQLQKGNLESYPAETSSGWIYEVVRLINDTPFFLPEHLDRFSKACMEIETPRIYSDDELIKGFFNVIRENGISEGNIRLQAELGTGKMKIGFIPHHYPTADDYRKGVVIELLAIQRERPNIKTWNKDVRVFSDKFIRANDVYEVILTSDDGFLLEGSRSNIFGLKKGVLITPPDENVLPGITRQKILDIAGDICMPVKIESIHKEEIYSFQSFFLSGTSPGILPIRRIGNNHFNCKSSPCNALKQSYKKEIAESIKRINQKYR